MYIHNSTHMHITLVICVVVSAIFNEALVLKNGGNKIQYGAGSVTVQPNGKLIHQK